MKFFFCLERLNSTFIHPFFYSFLFLSMKHLRKSEDRYIISFSPHNFFSPIKISSWQNQDAKGCKSDIRTGTLRVANPISKPVLANFLSKPIPANPWKSNPQCAVSQTITRMSSSMSQVCTLNPTLDENQKTDYGRNI